ncbi:MAG: hypothetical protein ABWZ30_04525, partial [Jiangellaceae bacterium]
TPALSSSARDREREDRRFEDALGAFQLSDRGRAFPDIIGGEALAGRARSASLVARSDRNV